MTDPSMRANPIKQKCIRRVSQSTLISAQCTSVKLAQDCATAEAQALADVMRTMANLIKGMQCSSFLCMSCEHASATPSANHTCALR